MSFSGSVLISILNYATPESTIQLVRQFASWNLTKHAIVVVDNHSPDDSCSRFRQVIPNVHLIASPVNGGYAAGHQLSVDYAMANGFDAIWILNPDLELHPDALNALLKAWESKGEGVFGSISLQSPDDDTILFAGAHELEGDKEISPYNPFKGQSLQAALEAQPIRKVTAVEGFSLFVPLSIIRQYGFMDHRYFMYGEETIWCYDLRKKGVPVFIVPDSIVYHIGYGSLGPEKEQNPVATYYRMRNAIYWNRKYYGLSRWKVLQRKSGPQAFLKFFVKYFFLGKKARLRHRIGYLENLAILHAFLGIKGRRRLW